ncbi:hypothetical protein ACHQM5_000234 [Ranunculus cassubicifolius]
MYAIAETGLLYPYFQSFTQEVQSFEELCGIQKSNDSLSNLIPTSTFFEYDLGGEGDLFKAPEPIIEEPVVDFDPVASAISMISGGEDVISQDTINGTDIGSMQCNSLLNEVFYECKKDLLANSAMKDSFSDVDIIVPAIPIEEDKNLEKNRLLPQGSINKSVSSGCLSSNSGARPNFLDFQGMDFGMRRAYSEGDMQTISNGSVIHSPFEKTVSICNYAIEDRLQKLTRYRKKKTKRNFGRTIKYACRKALADSQPRVRGRFAKTDELEIPRK